MSSREKLPTGCVVSLHPKPEGNEKPLTLRGIIVWAARHTTDYKPVYKYGIRFNESRQDVLPILKRLMPPR
jgi:hypothetical protein